MTRFKEIDGIRGWAALCVLLFHLSWEIFGGIFPVFRFPFIKFFLDGPLAVYIFFILSGDALSSGYVNTGDRNLIIKMIFKRYFRLLGPIIFSCFLVYFLMSLNLTFNVEASKIVNREDWLGTFLPFKENFYSVLLYGANQVFTSHQIINSYNPFLWPMSIELFGSALVFCFLIIHKNFINPLKISVLISIYLFLLGSYYSLFFIGISFSILRKINYFNRISLDKYSNLRSFLLIFSVVVLDCFLSGGGVFLKIILSTAPQSIEINNAAEVILSSTEVGKSIFAYVVDFLRENIEPIRTRFYIFFSTIIVYAVYGNVKCISFLTSKLSLWLGKISFSLYLTHFAVIISYTSWLIVTITEIGSLNLMSALFIVTTSVLLAFIIAVIFSKIESFYLVKLNNFSERILNF